ncbi:nitroreductase family protein [Oceaniglobus ichthyenteri]|uniref:nitroreductase family protein n=1 Tax=Oceaniglobus ichthyenteri TaxID=2136177 RepID=UPI000D3668FC|nr:nitroreductase [Oceaniglobus ichthyenteri]
MPTPNPAALEFLLTRRSRPWRTLCLPAPDRDALHPLLTAAARTPDHGKLEPWRFIVLERPALDAMAQMVADRGGVTGVEPEKLSKSQAEYATSPLAVVVVAAPKPSEKIPQMEQHYSAGAVCLALLNAALAAGWGANWLSGWPSRDPEITAWLGLSETESIAGIIHIGTESAIPPDRPRPDLGKLTTWFTP